MIEVNGSSVSDPQNEDIEDNFEKLEFNWGQDSSTDDTEILVYAFHQMEIWLEIVKHQIILQEMNVPVIKIVRYALFVVFLHL